MGIERLTGFVQGFMLASSLGMLFVCVKQEIEDYKQGQGLFGYKRR